jgi:hypothetical protein
MGYLNWALGFCLLGCKIIWLETMSPNMSINKMQAKVTSLIRYLNRYGLDERIAICSSSSKPIPQKITNQCLDLETASESDLLYNFRYSTRSDVVARFRRIALLDIDLGLLQLWISLGKITIPHHDVNFTIGETVGRPAAKFHDGGLKWRFTPPCVALECWPAKGAPGNAPFTTVTPWTMAEWMVDGDEVYSNDKRTGFFSFLELPKLIGEPFELALCLTQDEKDETAMPQKKGWKIRHTWDVTSTPWDYQYYIKNSRGELSCAKPSCNRLQNAWISDRTICYLASGKTAIRQYTGSSRFLPDAAGLFRFHTIEDARRSSVSITEDYENQCRKDRSLAEEYFDSKKVVKSVLEHTMS